MIPAVEPGLRWYRCTVLVEGPVSGQLDLVVAYTLEDQMIGTAKLALRWLRDQALRVANGLDPQPAYQLRMWANDPEAQQLAREELTVTGRTRVTARDSFGRCWLTAQRVAVSAQPPAPAAAPPRTGHRRHARNARRSVLAGSSPP